MAARSALAAPLVLLALLSACTPQVQQPQDSSCFNRGSTCAAAEAPRGMRRVLKGHRMVRAQWLQKTNRESGVPDIGIQAEWEPITERQ